MTQTAPLLQTY